MSLRTISSLVSPALRISHMVERKLRVAFSVPAVQTYSHFRIELPPEHRLPEYQRTFPLYDRFLPRLVQELKGGDHVVDVGANCGDTLAAMAAENPNCIFTCIEPDDLYFWYLRRNALAIERYTARPIKLVKALIGKSLDSAVLIGGGGTRRATAVGGSEGGSAIPMASVSLDHLIGNDPVRLLKSDVDGFDFDVIDSGSGLISQQRPLLYFECQVFDMSQYHGFLRTTERLLGLGYRFFLFDNFGNPLLGVDKVAVLDDLLKYVLRQDRGFATRTINYYDILAYVPSDAALVERVLAAYAGSAEPAET